MPERTPALLPDLYLYDTADEFAAAAAASHWCRAVDISTSFDRYLDDGAFDPAACNPLLTVLPTRSAVQLDRPPYGFVKDGVEGGPDLVDPLARQVLVLAENSRRGIRTEVPCGIDRYWRSLQPLLPCPLLLAADRKAAAHLSWRVEKPYAMLRLTYHGAAKNISDYALHQQIEPFLYGAFSFETFDEDDLPRLLRALDDAMAHCRPGTGRAHLTLLTPFDAARQHDPDDEDYYFMDRFHAESRRPVVLLDTAGGTLAPPPGQALPLRAPYGLYEGWQIFNRRHHADTIRDRGSDWGPRNPTVLCLYRAPDGKFYFDELSCSKYPTYWELMARGFCAYSGLPGTTWLLMPAVDYPMAKPEVDLKQPCLGMMLDGTAHTLTRTENYDALAMFRDALTQLPFYKSSMENSTKED